ncbi:MAG TPA: glycoside hydrolase family 3 protein [Drouetiella sp.]
MNDDEKLSQSVGRLLVARIPGLILDSVSKQALEEGTIGGAVLFKENGQDLQQLHTLCTDIVKHSFHPPVLTADQEGGAVQRFEHILTPIPSPMALAACGREGMIHRASEINASQLKKLGFNCLLSPVLDVLSNPLNPIIGTRAYSDNPHRVGVVGAEVIDAIKDGGLVPVGKHFPGHGATLEDSHTDLAVNPIDSKALWNLDLLPFRQLLDKMPSILVGHLWLSAIDPEPLPSTLSKRVTHGILREYLGYDGLIMTDDMVMKAITAGWGLAEACVMALDAGCDLLLTCGDINETLDVHKHIVEAVKSGRLSRERIDDAVQRVDKLFSTRPEVISKDELPEFQSLLDHQFETCLLASCAAITLVRGEIPPINSGNWVVLVPNHARYPMKIVEHLNKLAKDRFSSLEFSELRYSIDPSPEEAQMIKSQCTERNCIYLTYRALTNQGQVHLGSILAPEVREKIQVASEVPFDCVGLESWENSIACYDPSDLAMQALAKVLLGQFTPVGTTPVSLEFSVTKTR